MKTGLTVEDDKIVSYVKQDVAPAIEQASLLRDIGHVGGSDMKHCATLPLVLIEKYCNDHSITYQEWVQNPVHIKSMLNDPQNEPFRVWKGRV